MTRRGFLMGATAASFGVATSNPVNILQEFTRLPLPSAAEIGQAYEWLCEHLQDATYGGGMFPKLVLNKLEILSRYIAQKADENPFSDTIANLKAIDEEWLETGWDSMDTDIAGDIIDRLNFASSLLDQPPVIEKIFSLRQEACAISRALTVQTVPQAIEILEETPRPLPCLAAAKEQQVSASLAGNNFRMVTNMLLEEKEEPQEAPALVPEERHLTL